MVFFVPYYGGYRKLVFLLTIPVMALLHLPHRVIMHFGAGGFPVDVFFDEALSAGSVIEVGGGTSPLIGFA